MVQKWAEVGRYDSRPCTRETVAQVKPKRWVLGDIKCRLKIGTVLEDSYNGGGVGCSDLR